MKDLTAQLEKLLTDAEDCELIAKLATAADKRELFQKLAADLRTIACDVQALTTNGRLAPRAASRKQRSDATNVTSDLQRAARSA
jgi:hypothetical protein